MYNINLRPVMAKTLNDMSKARIDYMFSESQDIKDLYYSDFMYYSFVLDNLKSLASRLNYLRICHPDFAGRFLQELAFYHKVKAKKWSKRTTPPEIGGAVYYVSINGLLRLIIYFIILGQVHQARILGTR